MAEMNTATAVKEAGTSPPPLLRLKRTARDAGFDELASAQKQRRTCSTPRTLRFRRLLSSNPASNRRVIDIDLAALVDSPSSSPLAQNTSPIAQAAVAPDKATEYVVYDLYEEINPGDENSPVVNKRIGWLNSMMLPSEFFGDLIPSDDDDADYSEGDERSVDYPDTPSSSADSCSDFREDDDDDISDTELGYLDGVLETNPLRGDAFKAPAMNTRSRLRQTASDKRE